MEKTAKRDTHQRQLTQTKLDHKDPNCHEKIEDRKTVNSG